MDEISFELLASPAGPIVAAPLVKVLIDVLKAVFPGLASKVSGALMAFVITGALYVLTALALLPLTPNGGLNLFAVWLTCAAATVGVNSLQRHAQEVADGKGDEVFATDPVTDPT